MARKTFSEILNDSNINLFYEYSRIHSLFYNSGRNEKSLYENCKESFIHFPFRDTCVTLGDFDLQYDFDYYEIELDVDEYYLISFCEYSYNLVLYLANFIEKGQFFLQHIKQVIEKVGYTEVIDNKGITDFVPKKPEAIIAAESVDDSNISFDILHYNHHSMKGNLDEKRKALSSFANYFEPKRMLLKNFNKDIENNLFCMFNEFSIRHEREMKNALLAEATDEKLEEYYDLTYELCLTAFSILGGMESNEKVKEMRKKLKK